MYHFFRYLDLVFGFLFLPDFLMNLSNTVLLSKRVFAKISSRSRFKIEISCHPRTPIKKLKKFFPKFLVKVGDTINQININAPIKIIVKNKKEKEIVSMFNEIIGEMKKINLREKAEFLEGKVSSNLDEKLYSELLSIRNQLKRG